MSFSTLVRFTRDNKPQYGEVLEHTDNGVVARPLQGSIDTGLERKTEESLVIPKAQILCPVEKTPLIICVGLNYRKHAEEASLSVPSYPVIFTKPADALAGPFDDVHVHPDAQKMMDYEGELTVVIGRDAKNVSEENALDYVFGYTLGNDVSARDFQLPDASGGQFCYAKSFDGFAPIGPVIWTSSLIKDPQTLRYTTKVNGEVRQATGTDDMIWSIKQIIAHLSRGTTLRKGTLIMTGTPSGVGLFRKQFLQHGDIVEVSLEGYGSIANRIVFDEA